MKKRFEDIDFLRGFAIVIIIVTHVYGLHLSNSRDFAIWNWLHFVVPGFLFCSGFVLAPQVAKFTSFKNTALWLGKRLTRLLIPYYIYFFFHFLLFLVFPSLFNNFHFRIAPEFLIGSIFFTGKGVSLSWLPILFVELTIFFPILWLLKKKGLLFYFKSIVLIAIAFITLSGVTVPMQQITHWFFWLYPFILGYIFADIEEQKRKNIYLLGSMVTLGIFIFLFMTFSATGKSLILTHHKYPPDLFYLAYSLGIEFLILFASTFLLRISLLKKVLFYFSKNSYRLFFVHYIVLDLVFSLTKTHTILGSAVVQTIFVISLTILSLSVWDVSLKRFVALRPKLSYK